MSPKYALVTWGHSYEANSIVGLVWVAVKHRWLSRR